MSHVHILLFAIAFLETIATSFILPACVFMILLFSAKQLAWTHTANIESCAKKHVHACIHVPIVGHHLPILI